MLLTKNVLETTHSRSWALLEKPPVVQPLKNFPVFYGTRRFITAFTRSLQWTLSWATSIQLTPSHSISPRSILILSTHLRFGLPSGLFFLAFPPKSYTHFSFPSFVLYAPPIASSLTSLFWLYLEKSASFEAFRNYRNCSIFVVGVFTLGVPVRI
jgi:hypothetical protein